MSSLRVIDGEQAGFSYPSLSREDEVAAREDAAIIRSHMRSAAESIIEVGLALKRQKERLPHGSFLSWIKSEFGMSQSAAYRFMSVADTYAGKLPSVGSLEPSVLYELAAPSTPQAVRDHVEALLVDGEKVTASDIRRLRSEAKAAATSSDAAVADAEAAETRANELQSNFDETLSAKVAEEAKKIEAGQAAKLEELLALQAQLEDRVAKLAAENSALRAPAAPAIPGPAATRDAGNVVAFTPGGLTDSEKAEIDAEEDDYSGAEFNENASADARARVVIHSARGVLSAKADAQAVFREMTEGKSPQTVAENKAMVDAVFTLFKKIKEQFDGKSKR